MNYIKATFLSFVLIGCSSSNTIHPLSDSLKTIAPQLTVQWDQHTNHPDSISDSEGFMLKPCDAGNENHQDLFIYLYTDPESIKGYLDSKPMSTPEALHVLINQSYRWNDGSFLSGFVGYTPKGSPFMHCGIGIFPSKSIAELFLIELPEFRNKGYGKKAMAFLNHWATFLKKAGTNINGENKHQIQTLIARVSPNNIPAIKLLFSSGFKSEFTTSEFSNEMNEPRPDHVKLIHSTITIEGKTHNVTLLTTPHRPEPKVIFLKRIN